MYTANRVESLIHILYISLKARQFCAIAVQSLLPDTVFSLFNKVEINTSIRSCAQYEVIYFYTAVVLSVKLYTALLSLTYHYCESYRKCAQEHFNSFINQFLHIKVFFLQCHATGDQHVFVLCYGVFPGYQCMLNKFKCGQVIKYCIVP